ncbi:MAG: leucyl/phenylalanyl-tRNA--protein transferase [Muricauda sp.]|nr:leucyl/phenylalanyl-tRNA--protein transferase [Allomuricauda sp.]
MPLYFLTERLEFPPVEAANAEGLLAVGGDLSPERLLLAYRNGIFPWFNDDSLILWWSPDPRMVLFPERVKISKSMRKVFRNNTFQLTQNTCFNKVLDYCAKVPRQGQEGTWITLEMKSAYKKLYEKGHAKSYEVWQDGELVGGLYGVDLGHVFCGESMFSLVPNASKFAFIKMAQELHRKGYRLIDCQVYTEHLESLGAELVPREKFMGILQG